jgi:hypothetical protein
MDLDVNSLILWLQAFFAIPETASFWSLLNSPILVSMIAVIIGWQLNQRIDAANSNAEVAAGLAEYQLEQGGLNEAPDEVSAEAEVPGEDFSEQVLEIADLAKAFIQTKIDNDRDRRHQRTYKKFSGHHPVARAVALTQRGQITADQERELINIVRMANRYNKGRAANRHAPKSVLEIVKASWDRVLRADR